MQWGLLACALAGVLSCTSEDDNVVHVYNWSDYIAEDTIANFERDTGIKVVYDVFDNNEVVEAKLLAGNTGYDVVVPSLHFMSRQIQAGAFQPLDRTQLSNYAQLDPVLMSRIADLDDRNRHGVPYMWGTTALGFNTAKVKAALGENAPLDSWALLFDPKNAEKLASCGIALLDTPEEVIPAALHYLGGNPNAFTAGAETDAAMALLKQIRPHVRYFHSSQYINDLANGDVCLVLGYSGDILQAADRAAEAGNGVEVSYVIPREGASLWIDMMVIPKDAKHPENAHAFINYIMRPEVMASISNHVSYANPVPASAPQINPDIIKNPGVYPKAETAAKLYMLLPLPPEQERARTRAWTELKTTH